MQVHITLERKHMSVLSNYTMRYTSLTGDKTGKQMV